MMVSSCASDDPARSCSVIVLNPSGPAALAPQDDGSISGDRTGLRLQPFPADASISGNAEFLLLSGREVIRLNSQTSRCRRSIEQTSSSTSAPLSHRRYSQLTIAPVPRPCVHESVSG